MPRPLRAAIAASALGISLAALGGSPAMAAAPLRGCTPNLGYSFSDVHRYFVTNKGPAVQASGRGGDRLYLAVAKGQSVHGEITGKGHFTYQGIKTQIDIDIDASIKLSWQESARQHRRWRVPAKWAHGWLAWGSYGYQFHWERVRTDASCTVEVLAHGTGKLPAKHLGFHTGRGIAPPETG